MRYLLLFLIVNFHHNCFSQFKDLNFYAEAEGYRNVSFKGNGLYGLGAGIGLFSDFWISPEIGFNYTFASPEDINQINSINANFSPEAIIELDINLTLLSISPKISINKKDNVVWWIVQPAFLTGNFNINANYFELSDSGNRYDLIENQRIKKSISFFTFAVGMEGYIIEHDRLSVSFSIKYTLNNVGSLLEDINFENTELIVPRENTQSLGIGIKLNFYAFKKPW